MMWGRRYIVHCIAVVGMGSLGVVWCGVVWFALLSVSPLPLTGW